MTVLVAGAGPAGARLAIRLAEAGEQVLLVDPLTDPHRNAYSSAAVPNEGRTPAGDSSRLLGLSMERLAAVRS